MERRILRTFAVCVSLIVVAIHNFRGSSSWINSVSSGVPISADDKVRKMAQLWRVLFVFPHAKEVANTRD